MPQEATPFARAITDVVARRYLGKPDLAELLRIKFPNAAALTTAALNEAAFVLRAESSFRLTTLNVEITNRCNLRCSYCPVNRDMERPKADLAYDRFTELIERTPTLTTLLPFQWGEPLLHPKILDMIAFATARNIRTYVTTNGTLLDDAMCRGLLRSGLARLTVSVDGDDAVHEATRGVALGPIRERVLQLKRMRDAEGSKMRIDVSMVVEGRTVNCLDAFFAAWTGIVDRVQAIPKMLAAPRTRACREPWRGLLVVLADGRVTTCCADSEGRLALGDVAEESPAEIFDGARMRALRRAHRDGELPDPCRNCSEFVHPRVSTRFS